MKRTERYRFGILISMLVRHERACMANGGIGVRHSLINVEKYDDHVKVMTTTGQRITLTGSVLSIDGFDIPLDLIQEIRWITRGALPRNAEDQKEKHFDRLHVRHHREWVMIDGLGQSVFPIMKFLEWAKTNG